MYLSSADAAARLGTGSGRVRALVVAGLLPGDRIAGRWLIPAEAVEERLTAERAAVRPMAARVAWAAAALADGHGAPWLGQSELSRLRARIRTAGTDVARWHAWLLRRAEHVARLRVADADLPDLLADQRVVAGGATAARAYGIPLGTGGVAEVYVESADRLAALRREYGLVAADRPSLVVRVAGGSWPADTATTRGGLRVVPAVVVAADLLDAGDSRSRAAGRDLLDRALRAHGG
jgi:hypothetical protein